MFELQGVIRPRYHIYEWLPFEAPIAEPLSERCRIAEAAIEILVEGFKLHKDLLEQIEEERRRI